MWPYIRFRFITTIILWYSVVKVFSDPQLDLPPVNPTNNRNTGFNGRGIVVIPTPAGPPADINPKVSLNSYTENNDEDDERVHGVASDYDRDRSQRFGPPYSIDNIERAGPFNGNNGNLDTSRGYNYGNPSAYGAPGFNTPGLNGGPDPLNAPGFNDSPGNYGGPVVNSDGRYGSPYSGGSPQGNRPLGDDDKYYQKPSVDGNVDFDRNRGYAGGVNDNLGFNRNQDFNRYPNNGAGFVNNNGNPNVTIYIANFR